METALPLAVAGGVRNSAKTSVRLRLCVFFGRVLTQDSESGGVRRIEGGDTGEKEAEDRAGVDCGVVRGNGFGEGGGDGDRHGLVGLDSMGASPLA